jgi:hypothetical protein
VTLIQAVPTRYAGCHFRSRLEARWAVFFDALGIRWEYEPEGYELPNGEWYLPDFWLPAIEVWLEVKGDFRVGWAKWRLFHEAINEPERADDWGWFVRYVEVDTVDLGNRIIPLAEPDRGLTHIATPRTFLIGQVPWPDETFMDHGIMLGPGSPHSGWAWCRCRSCGEIDIAHVAFESFMHCGAQSAERSGPQAHRIDALAPEILAAYAAARSARFEHGESGPT